MTGGRVVDYAARRAAGAQVYRDVMRREPPAPVTPRAAALLDFVFAEIWSRPGIRRRERRLIAISCAAGADGLATLAEHVYGALASGDLSYDEVHEVVLHYAVYCGWAKAEVFEQIVEQQWAVLHAERGTTPTPRPEEPLTSIAADQDQRTADGEEEFRVVNCVQAPPRGVPYYHDGILHYVFGDMWKRPGLSRRDRRWVTLACVGFDDTLIPVRSHVYSAMKSGDIAYDEMRELVLQFAAYSGWPKASYLQQAVDEEHGRVVAEAAAEAASADGADGAAAGGLA